MRPNSNAARDIAFSLHPYTNARRHEQIGPMIVKDAKGIYVYDENGKEYIEAMSGLWSVAVGWGNERLVSIATQQMKQLAYYHSFSHKSNAPSVDLAEKLVSILPGSPSKIFFTNSGSEANDTVVKIVWYYNNALGRPEKKKIISRQKAYHGVTVASASLTGLPANHKDFDLPIRNILHTSCPHHYRFAKSGESEEEFASRLAQEFEDMILSEGPNTIAAFIGEPLMGAGGVITPPATYWEKMQAVCRKYDILIIADEVITGFGRTGNFFGCETYGITPDITVVSKQLTSSYLPLAAVGISDEIYQAIADNSQKIGTFGHGYTTSGHPVATAVGLENIKIMEDLNLIENVRTLSPILQDGLRAFADHPLIGEVRGIGLIAAVEFVADKKEKRAFEQPGKLGTHLLECAQEEGLIVRALGDTIAFCPPLIIREDEIKAILDKFERVVEKTYLWSKEMV